MELTFLGTSYAVPTKRRNHSAIWITHEGESILLDCGEGTQRQFKKAELNAMKITKLVLTHWHGDHILGIPGLLQTLALNNYSKELEIYGPRGTKKFMEMMKNLFIHSEDLKFKVNEIGEGDKIESKDLRITAFEMDHGVPCLAYSIEQKDRVKIDMAKLKKIGLKEGPLIGELQRGKDVTVNGKKIKAKDVTFLKKGKKIAVVLDTKLNSNCIKAAKDSDLLVCETTYLESDKDKASEYKHLTASQAAEIAHKSKSKQLYLTHISQRYESNELQILKEAKKKFKNTFLANDLMNVKLDK